MSSEITNSQTHDALTNEDYSKAMNFIAQNLLSSLTQSVEKLSVQFHNRKVISQAISAFLVNVIYKQFPDNQEACEQMLGEITKIVTLQIDAISHS